MSSILDSSDVRFMSRHVEHVECVKHVEHDEQARRSIPRIDTGMVRKCPEALLGTWGDQKWVISQDWAWLRVYQPAKYPNPAMYVGMSVCRLTLRQARQRTHPATVDIVGALSVSLSVCRLTVVGAVGRLSVDCR